MRRSQVSFHLDSGTITFTGTCYCEKWLRLFCCAAAGVGVLWFFFYRWRKYKLTAESKERFLFSTSEPLEYLLLGTILFFLVAIAGNNFYWVISDFFNPEFYALRHLPFSQ